jgi:hypothetical protein
MSAASGSTTARRRSQLRRSALAGVVWLPTVLLCVPRALAAPEDQESSRAVGQPAPESGSLPQPAADNLDGRGLVKFKDLFPFALLHLQLPVDTLQRFEKGTGELSLDYGWGNSFANREGEYTVDAESFLIELSAWYALTDRVSVGATLPYIFRDAGVLDPVVEGFHDVFGLSNDERREASTNDYEVTVVDEKGRTRTLDRGLGLGDLVLKGHWNVHAGTLYIPAVALEGLVGVPTSLKGFGGAGVDFGAVISLHKTIGEGLHLHLSGGGTYYTDRRTEGLRFEKLGWQVAGGVEYEITETISLALQGTVISAQLEFPSPLNRSRSYLGGGLKWDFATNWELEVNVMENLVPQKNSADIVFGAGLSFRF